MRHPNEPVRRRGSWIDPANRFSATCVEINGDAVDHRLAEQRAAGEDAGPARVPLQIFPDRTKTIINAVTPTSDVPFNWTLNPYRGCEHGCVYCFARPFHEFLGFSCGLDFETKLTVKQDAPELLRRELAHSRWTPEPIVMSAITDIYQPIEAEQRLARRCLEVFAETEQPVSTMTKGALSLIRRDLDLWSRMAARGTAQFTVTLVTLDAELAMQLEPRAAPPAMRLRAIRELTEAGIPVSVNVAPVIPGLTDSGVPDVLSAVADAGAKRIRWVTLRLPHQLKAVFTEWLERVCPERRDRVLSAVRAGQGGALYRSENRWQKRGRGPASDATADLIDVFIRRHGFDRDLPPLRTDRFRPPVLAGQQFGLFGA